MNRISTGEPSTLGTYRKIALALVGEGNKAVQYFDDKIAKQGEDMEVIAHETQVLLLIATLLNAEDK